MIKGGEFLIKDQESKDIFFLIEGLNTVSFTTEPNSPLIKLDASFNFMPFVSIESIMTI